jgi:D-alanyl-D-alanine dipeptidase
VATSTPSTSDVRAWAQKNGVKVAARGRISAEVLDAWKAAHPQQVRKVTSNRTPAPQAGPSRAGALSTGPSRSAGASADVTSANSDRESNLAKVEARLAALEQRLEAVEQRLVDANSSTVPKQKGRLFRRS